MKIKLTPYPEGEDIGIAKISVTYVQEADGNDIERDEQKIIISTEDCPGTDFDYYFIIETKRWAINEAQDLADLINDFKNRLTLISNEQRKNNQSL